MKKDLLKFLPVLFLILSGCLNYTQITTIKLDGSGNMFVHYWIKVKSPQDTLLYNSLGIFNKDSIHTAFSSRHLNISNVEVYQDPEDSTVHAKVELTFKYIDSLNSSKAFKDLNFSIKDGPENVKIFSQFIPPFATGFGFDNRDFTLEYIYYLPGNILEHNAHDISKNRLTWSFKLSEIGTGKTITATYRPFKLKETPSWIYFLAAGVIFVLIIFLFRKKR